MRRLKIELNTRLGQIPELPLPNDAMIYSDNNKWIQIIKIKNSIKIIYIKLLD